MNESFGPWSTAINTGVHPQLSTFWKRRLTMLPSLAHVVSRPNWGTLLVMGNLAVAFAAWPTVHWATFPGNAVGSDEGLALAQVPDKPATQAKDAKSPEIDEFLPRPSKIEAKILASLANPTTVEFIDLPLEDCITFLKEYHNVNIWMDKATLTDEGVPPDKPITFRISDVSFRSILNLILEPLQLTYVVEDDVMKITTQKQAKKKQITRTYPVRDLYLGRIKAVDNTPADKIAEKSATPARPGDLEKAITNAVDPESWDETKGPASITYVKESGSLVIRQSWGAHQKILSLLRDLREAKRTASGEKK